MAEKRQIRKFNFSKMKFTPPQYFSQNNAKITSIFAKIT
jgi:hypothetical protein